VCSAVVMAKPYRLDLRRDVFGLRPGPERRRRSALDPELVVHARQLSTRDIGFERLPRPEPMYVAIVRQMPGSGADGVVQFDACTRHQRPASERIGGQQMRR